MKSLQLRARLTAWNARGGPRSFATNWPGLFAISAAVVLVGQALPAGTLRALVVFPPVLVVPGFALVTLLFGEERPRDPALLGVVTVALSLAVLISDALLLNATGLRLSTVSLGLTTLVAAAALCALLVASGRPVVPPGRATMKTLASRPAPVTRGLAVGASVLAAVGFVTLVAVHLPAPAGSPFTSLSLGSSWAGRANPPTVRTGQVVDIPVVATGAGARAALYDLTTAVDGRVESSRDVSVSSRGTWSGSVAVVTPAGRSLHRVVISFRSLPTPSTPDQVIVYLDNDGS